MLITQRQALHIPVHEVEFEFGDDVWVLPHLHEVIWWPAYPLRAQQRCHAQFSSRYSVLWKKLRIKIVSASDYATATFFIPAESRSVNISLFNGLYTYWRTTLYSSALLIS